MDHEGATYKTLRDEIAIAVMAAWMSSQAGTLWATGRQIVDATKEAYRWADAMLEARDQ